MRTCDLPILVGLALTTCGGVGCGAASTGVAADAAAAVDSGSTNVSPDAGLDASTALDASSMDAVAPDAFAPDSGSPDAAMLDAGPADASSLDAALPDGHALDVGPADSGFTADAGTGISVLHSFDGDQGIGPTGAGKPMMNVAANGTQVAQVTGHNLNVYDYAGGTISSNTLAAVITSAGLNPIPSGNVRPYEPHIVFDEFIDRWIVVASCRYDCVLVSDGSDLSSPHWAGFYLDNQGNDPSIHIAYDKNGVYFTEIIISAANPDTPIGATTQVLAIPSSELQWTTTLNPPHRNKTIGKPLDLMPVIDNNPNKAPGAPAFFVARTCANGGCQSSPGNLKFQWIVAYGTWSGTTFSVTSNHTSMCSGGAAPSDQCVRTDPNGTSDLWVYNMPRDPDQPGTTVKLRGAEIHRILDAMQLGNRIEVALGSGPCNGNCGAHGMDFGHNIFIWAEIDCSSPASCTVTQTQKGSTAQDDYLWASVGVDPIGNVGIVASFVNGTTDSMGIAAWGHASTDPSGALNGPTLVVAGTTPYTCSLNGAVAQTGNPVGVTTVRDPLDPTTLWVSEHYANDSGDCRWDTRIVQYRP
jgi:hypothetical protein